ncbi:unnamed protein product, partial [Rotaria sp. Silwood1]
MSTVPLLTVPAE